MEVSGLVQRWTIGYKVGDGYRRPPTRYDWLPFWFVGSPPGRGLLEFALGPTVGPYVLVAFLSRGTMPEVYKGNR